MTLADYITSHLQTPFGWGTHDCVTFTVGWLEARTGRDYLSAHRPWTSAAQAARIVKRLGGLQALFDAHLAPIHPNLARDGDVTIYQDTAYIFSGRNIVSAGESGLIFNPRAEATCAWSC